MSLTEIEFAFFLPAVLLLYWLLPRRASWQNAVLLAASYVFYAAWNPRLAVLLLVATAVDYLAALAIDRSQAAAASGSAVAARRMRIALGVSFAANLGTLAYFKYAGFFAESLNGMLGSVGLSMSLPVLRVLLPLGISFYTLQKLGYVIDVYYGRVPAQRSALVFATFAAFFPQVTAGPISRAGMLLPQLELARTIDPARIASGAGLFLVGYVLKGYVADTLGAMLVNPVFAGGGAGYGVLAHWLALVGYAAQIFSDFAGYSLLAIGCARLFSIELPQNFNLPFLSRSLPDFWRRWHITLNSWLFDYIYTPLTTGALRGRFDLALMIVFLASGLWHGAAATFVLWGAMHGVGMVVYRHWDEFYRGLCRRDRAWVKRRQSAPYRFASWFLTQLFFLLSLVPFGAASIGDAGAFARGLVVSTGTAQVAIGISILLCAAILVAFHLAGTDGTRRLRELAASVPAPVRGAAYAAAIAWLLVFVPIGASAFIYRQF